MRHSHGILAAACLAALAGCSATSPAQFASTLPRQDPKWSTPECARMRADAATYESREKQPPVAFAAVFPYGTLVVATAKEHLAKQRKAFKRDMHLACSSQPLPAGLEPDTAT